MKNENFFSKCLNLIKSIFFNGIFAIFPIAVTVFFINFAYNFMSRWLAPLREVAPELMKTIPGSEFIIFILLIIAMGVILKFFIFKAVIYYFEIVIKNIPIINTVYSGAKTLVDFFNVPDPTHVEERKVVLIKYPKKEFYNLAFLLGPASKSFSNLLDDKAKDEPYFKVFMPNTPNPSTGYFFILPKSEIIETEITFEEAIKTIVSCGLITPESLKD